ncbi:alpha/beta hydrolase [Streptomyces polygonati]|uniref:Alpha/beta hydrolase n=1 Tax=Streptomyces polygonati TaxID=1617087 RepID=A0ABV8HUG7_9ACTN
MTAFVLVSGPWTGGPLWREVAAKLREAGAEVYPAELTGMGEAAPAAGPDTDLDTHIGDLLRLIDAVDEPRVVLVGHGLGVHPVLGAADRRPERIGRIVYLDSGLPRDGESVLDQIPDQGVRDRLLKRAEEDKDRLIPPPSRAEWPLWGSTADLTEDALDRLAGLAVPQPLGTIEQPLRLSGAADRVPVTGVLCTGNGSSIGMVETVMALGDPRFRLLGEPWVDFIEIGAGHWPMLSVPGELAGVLLRAAAGRGQRVTARAGEETMSGRPFLLDVPERPRERVGRVDLYPPDAGTDGPRPAVLFVHGGPVPPDRRPTPRDWPAFVGYARYAASQGVFGVTLDHRLHGLGDFGRAAEDLAEAVELVRADPRVDADRIALWHFSAGGLLATDWLAAPPPWLRCLAASYPVLAPPPNWGLAESRFRPSAAVRGAGRLPIVLTRVGLESPEIAATVEEFLTAAEDSGAGVELIDVPLAHHGFETLDHTDETRRAVRAAFRSVLAHLRS